MMLGKFLEGELEVEVVSNEELYLVKELILKVDNDWYNENEMYNMRDFEELNDGKPIYLSVARSAFMSCGRKLLMRRSQSMAITRALELVSTIEAMEIMRDINKNRYKINDNKIHGFNDYYYAIG